MFPEQYPCFIPFSDHSEDINIVNVCDMKPVYLSELFNNEHFARMLSLFQSLYYYAYFTDIM